VVGSLLLLAAVPLAGQDEAPELGWSVSAELSLVAASGNAEARTLGFKGALERTWDRSCLVFEAGALEARATTRLRTALLLPGGTVRLLEEDETRTTAEAYSLRGRYDRRLEGGWGWFGGAGWERNELAGLADRYSGVGGLSRTWFDCEREKLRTSAGLTYTREDLVVEDTDRADSFLGLRLSWDYLRALTATTVFTSLLALDENLDDTSDLRIDTTQAVAVTMSERLALKVSLQLLYDAEPAFAAVPILDAGAPSGDALLVELDELDSLLTVALVVGF
jgi:putative salt-induced outer membrane protein YdiY